MKSKSKWKRSTTYREQTKERGTLIIPFHWKQIGLVSKNPIGSLVSCWITFNVFCDRFIIWVNSTLNSTVSSWEKRLHILWLQLLVSAAIRDQPEIWINIFVGRFIIWGIHIPCRLPYSTDSYFTLKLPARDLNQHICWPVHRIKPTPPLSDSLCIKCK